jgi:hypothetical protein
MAELLRVAFGHTVTKEHPGILVEPFKHLASLDKWEDELKAVLTAIDGWKLRL